MGGSSRFCTHGHGQHAHIHTHHAVPPVARARPLGVTLRVTVTRCLLSVCLLCRSTYVIA